MKSDLYLKAVLTVIAVALVVLTLQAVQPAFSDNHEKQKQQKIFDVGPSLEEIAELLCGKTERTACYVKMVK